MDTRYDLPSSILHFQDCLTVYDELKLSRSIDFNSTWILCQSLLALIFVFKDKEFTLIYSRIPRVILGCVACRIWRRCILSLRVRVPYLVELLRHGTINLYSLDVEAVAASMARMWLQMFQNTAMAFWF